MTAPLSLRAYAKHRAAAGLTGGTLAAVQQAIKAGRLRKSLTRDGRIRDAAAADAEWKATTREEKIPNAAKKDGTPDLADSRARREAAEAELAEIELAEKKGTLVKVADVEASIVADYARCRTRLLGIHVAARQRDPTLTKPQILLIEELVREALADLARDVESDAA